MGWSSSPARRVTRWSRTCFDMFFISSCLTLFAWIAKIRSMLRRRCGVVMDEEYVQEHISTDGIVAPVGRRLADSFMAAYSHFARRSRVILDPSLLVWLLLCLSRSESHGDCRAAAE